MKALLDRHIEMHKWCAYMICLMSYIHIVAHYYNIMRLTESHNSTVGVIQALNNLTDENGLSYVNPIPRGSKNYIASVFGLVGGWTGTIMTLLLILIFTSAQEPIRRSFFELFWVTHHLFIVFFVFLVFHGHGRQIRGQDNLTEHDPVNCSESFKIWGEVDECPMPTFSGSSPSTWQWVIVPIALYIIERIFRLFRLLNPSKVTKIVFHRSNVIEIQMQKPSWNVRGDDHEVGEYIYLNCRNISYLEWHPFTLTSAPEEDYLSVHIRVVGDWTGKLKKTLLPFRNLNDIPTQIAPRIAVDGPYGSASQNVFDYETAVCVGTGIGITPFASFLKSIYYRKRDGVSTRLRKVYFIWICPDMYAFEWFTDWLKQVEKQLDEMNERNLLNIGIYLSRGWNNKIARVNI